MKIEQNKWTPGHGWADSPKINPHLVLAFGDRYLLSNSTFYEDLKKFYSQANIVLASTSGSILETSILDEIVVSTAIAFEQPDSKIELKKTNIKGFKNSFLAGQYLGNLIPKEGLVHLFVISDGHLVNGSDLLTGITGVIPPQVAVTGGLAGDGTRFEKTLVGANSFPIEGEIVIIGFYGSHLKFGFGSMGGWDPFGIERKITRSSNNVLYELDGKNALELYKTYLGKQAEKLPSSALLFPLAIRPDRKSLPLVRTILSINEKDQSMTFAGNLPEGWYAQLMKANFDRLVDGAAQAAQDSYEMLGKLTPDLAILISCVGRRIVMDQRTEEEIENVRDVIGNKALYTGFYSYGEIAPTAPHAGGCELHNQTMTITTISER